MIAFGTQSQAAARRRAIPSMGVTFVKAEWMDSGEDPVLSPTVSLIEQPAGFEFMPHFHRNNQFQVFVGGSGAIGAHPLAPVVVHYAGAYTGYGPLVAGPQGIQYFTMRTVAEAGFIPVAEYREKMIRGPKRHAQSQQIEVRDVEAMSRLREIEDGFVISLGDDGMGARLLRIPAGRTLDVEHPPGCQGQFIFVLAGAVEVAGRQLSRWEQLYATRDEPIAGLRATEGGAQMLCLGVPPQADPYRAKAST
ncbi:MAG: hypothetical protein JWQ03_389 [Variovorax sp.]|nr:hypothetical protein [Variovorax sp.]